MPFRIHWYMNSLNEKEKKKKWFCARTEIWQAMIKGSALQYALKNMGNWRMSEGKYKRYKVSHLKEYLPPLIL